MTVDPTCPGSPATSMHSKCKLHVSFAQSCNVVSTEMLARIAGLGGFVDPHNGGTYSLLESSATSLLGQRITGSGSSTHYTDRFLFTFSSPSSADAGCNVTACSESQGTSLYDSSTNFCNLHVLYCNDSEGCPSVMQPDLAYTETTIDCTHGLRTEDDPHQCLPHRHSDNLNPSSTGVTERPVFVTIAAILLLVALVGGVLCLVFGKKRSVSTHATAEVSTITATASAEGSEEFNMELNDAAKEAMSKQAEAIEAAGGRV